MGLGVYPLYNRLPSISFAPHYSLFQEVSANLGYVRVEFKP